MLPSQKAKVFMFCHNTGKINLIPAQKPDILDFTIDSVAMTVCLKETKKKDLSNLISKTVNKNFIEIRKLSQIIGKIVAALPGSIYCALYDLHFELNKQDRLKCAKGNYEGYVEITKKYLPGLTLWKENVPNIYQKLDYDKLQL